MASRLHVLRRCHHAEALVAVDGREDHTLTLDAHHLARRKVGHKEDALADQLLGILIELGDARADGAVGARTVVDGELKQFFTLLHLLTVFHQTHADVEFLKLLERYGVFDRRSLIGGSLVGFAFARRDSAVGASSTALAAPSVSFLRSLELVELALDHLVLDLLEEQCGLTQLMTGLQQIG